MPRFAAILCLLMLSISSQAAPPAAAIDLTNAVIVTPEKPSAGEQKAVAVLIEEVEKRTRIRLAKQVRWPDQGAVIAVGLRSDAERFAGPLVGKVGPALPAEGFTLDAQIAPRPAVLIAGSDSRGLLYGIGRFLRKMDWSTNHVSISSALHIESSPKFPLRGDQLGYRPKVNAYDAWTEAQFDQYIRELALFGANSIEILPPRTDDQRTSPLMKLPPLEMMERLSSIIDSYGLDVWIWYPNIGKDYTSEAGLAAELAEREEVFRRLKRIDHILVPGGDPGNLAPEVTFHFLDRLAPVLHKYHQKAKFWLSPQGFAAFEHARFDSFIDLVNKKPQWLGGVTYGPWVPVSLPKLRSMVDKDIPFRNYPDITHNVVCQFPVPNWDMAFALTLHRECFNPRPIAMKAIHNLYAKFTIGSLCYSEGINDDVNKFIWLDQDWDPSTPASDTLHDYAHAFISPAHADDIAKGFVDEEQNWVGPLAGNAQVDATLEHWRQLEAIAPPSVRENYRFQMGLMRAYYDDYIKLRLANETKLEAMAMDALRTAPAAGSFAAMEKAEAILGSATLRPIGTELKQKCESLADSLFDKIGSQLTVKKHFAQHRTRGAFMDGIDEPLNNIDWLRVQFRHARDLPDEPERLAAIDKILNRTNPGPGGFYDSLGSFESEHRIVNHVSWAEDPGNLESPRTDYPYNLGLPELQNVPLAWRKQKMPLFDGSLTISYDKLDPAANYLLRVTYAGEFTKPSSLVANDKFVIHQKVDKSPTHEFKIPHEATADGHLQLQWRGGGVAEVWLMKQSN